LEPADVLAVAEQVLGYAEAAGSTEAEALVSADDARLTRFANSEIHEVDAKARVERRERSDFLATP
jgi:hypothetical protein